MNLDDFSSFKNLDSQNLLAEIDGLPDQLAASWELGQKLPLPDWKEITGALVCGVSSMALGADLLAAYVAPACPVPIVVNRGYDLPAWTRRPGTLVIVVSQADTPEETLASFRLAAASECRVLVLCPEGELLAAARKAEAAAWQFEHQGQPRSALGTISGLLLAAFFRLGLIADPAAELAGAVAAMKAQQEFLRAEVPLMQNPAKRLAGQSMGRWVAVLGADFLEPVAHRWKSQINETAKAWAQFESLPEADHNTLAGVVFPEQGIPNTFALFLQAAGNHPRNQLRIQLTQEIMMLEGVGTDFVIAGGDLPLAQMWTLIHFGDYLAYYLAMLYEVDPASVETVEALKARLDQV